MIVSVNRTCMNAGKAFSFLITGAFCLLSHFAGAQTWDKPYPGNEPGILYYPDQYAVYFRYGWDNTTPIVRVIKGKSPKARYFSFNVYDDRTKGSLFALADYKLKMDTDGTYTIYLVPQGTAERYPNQITIPDSVKYASVFLRYYVPEGDMYASVPLPSIYLSRNGSLAEAPPSIPMPAPDKSQAKAIENILRSDPKRLTGKERKELSSANTPESRKEELVSKIFTMPVFRQYKEPGNIQAYNFQADGNYPNKDNHYILMPVVQDKSKVLMVRFRPPVHATTLGDTTREVRYFSLSQGDEFTRTSLTLYDNQLRVAEDGFVYVAISRDTALLRETSSRLTVNTMLWYHGKYMTLILRHMLPAPSFANSTDHVPLFSPKLKREEQEAGRFIGNYALFGKYIKSSALRSAASPGELFR